MDMACNAFLKIAKSTSDQFTIVQQNESQPYIRDIIRRMHDLTKKLSNDSLQFIFYESIGHLISAEQDSNVQLQLMKEVLGQYLFEYFNMMSMAQNNPNFLKEQEIIKKIVFFLKLNENLAVGVGRNYALMLEVLSETMNKLYLFFSSQVTSAVNINGKNVLNFMTVRSMRMVKKEVIKVYTRMLEKSSDLTFDQANYILNKYIYPLG